MSRMYDRAMDRRDMRDRARRDRQMRDVARGRGRDRGMDYGMDGRNPYGSRGGYVDSRRDYGDMRSRDYGRDYNRDYGDMRDYGYDGNDMRDYGREKNPFRDFNDGHYMDYDYASGEKLSEEDLKEWYEELCDDLSEQYKQVYKKENIQQVAKQMNVEYEKFKPMELVVTTLMIANSYPKSVGYADINRNVAMAKEWLEDKKSAVKGGEKLSAYYDNIVKG